MSRLTSTRFGISYPNPATRDEPADVPSDLQLLVFGIEGQATRYSQGLFSARPAAGKIGSFYYATDQTLIYYDTGAAWITIGPPAAGSIGPTQLANDAVQTVHIASGAVGADEIATDAVGTSEIAPGAVSDVEVAAANKDGASGTYSMRRLGTSAGMAAAGTHAAQHALAGADPLPANSVGASQIQDDTVGLAELTAAVEERLFQPGFPIPWPYAEASIPTGFAAMYGQAISRASNPVMHAAAAAASYPHGNGDGSTTFNVMDTRGRSLFGKDDTGGTAANRITSTYNGTTLGGVFGTQEVTLTLAQTPVHSHTVNSHNHGGVVTTVGDHDHAHPISVGVANFASSWTPVGGNAMYGFEGGSITIWGWPYTWPSGSHNHGIPSEAPGTNSQGSGGAHPNLPPGIIVNWICRLG